MKILLDENFPLALYHRFKSLGYDVEHLTIAGQRGLPDAAIRERLKQETLVFLTQDTEFEELAADCKAQVIISRVSQSLPIQERVELWSKAFKDFLKKLPAQKLFELLETGAILPIKTKD